MEYTSGQFAKLMEISLDTLRYYEKEGLIKSERKENNHRVYHENDVKWMEFIKRLKDTGMPIKEIKIYAKLRAEGAHTMSNRMELLINHRKALKERMKKLSEDCIRLDEKIEYYEEMIRLQNK